MSEELFYEIPKKSSSTHSLWVEKYRPTDLEYYIGNDQLKAVVKSYIDKRDIPHLMFYGDAGTGKTTLAKLITKNINCDVLYINASDENSVETVRTKIKGFASTTGYKPLKVIILDECDFLSLEAQAAMRNLMETFSLTTRFILTCNYQEKIIPALISRCQSYKISPINKRDVALHLKTILEKENVGHKIEEIGQIVNAHYPDIRKILNFAQQSVIDNSIKINSTDVISSDTKSKLIDLLKNNTNLSNTFTSIRQLVADNNVKMFDEYYSLLYDKVDEYAKGKEVSAIITIAEYLHQSSLVVDKEITFMACIAALLKVK